MFVLERVVLRLKQTSCPIEWCDFNLPSRQVKGMKIKDVTRKRAESFQLSLRG